VVSHSHTRSKIVSSFLRETNRGGLQEAQTPVLNFHTDVLTVRTKISLFFVVGLSVEPSSRDTLSMYHLYVQKGA